MSWWWGVSRPRSDRLARPRLTVPQPSPAAAGWLGPGARVAETAPLRDCPYRRRTAVTVLPTRSAERVPEEFPPPRSTPRPRPGRLKTKAAASSAAARILAAEGPPQAGAAGAASAP